MSPPRYLILEKPVGQTPLEAVNAWKVGHPEYATVPATYAGRLDPMASGKLLVLLGKECARREQYTGLDKEYEIEVVLDLSTDTGDTLGMPNLEIGQSRPSRSGILRVLRRFNGTQTLPYPAFSSKTINGKPLFQYALEGTLDTVSIPTHEETVYRMKLLTQGELTSKQLQVRIQEVLREVPRSDEPSKLLGADFRQDAIRNAWDGLFDSLLPGRSFTVVRLRITCASGTYMRTLAERLGRALGTQGFALSIHRTKMGTYVPLGPFGFWLKEYT